MGVPPLPGGFSRPRRDTYITPRRRKSNPTESTRLSGQNSSDLTKKSPPTGALPYIAQKRLSGAPRCPRRLGAPQTLHTPPETACCAAAPTRRSGSGPPLRLRPSPPPGTAPSLGRRRAPAPARIWPRLAHTPPRRSAPGNRPIPALLCPHGPVSAPRTPARRPRPASPGVCLRPAPTAPLARLRVYPSDRRPSPPRPPPRHNRPVSRRPPAPERAVPPRPGLKGLCPQGGSNP